MSSLTIVPAYGRDYKSQAEVKAAWKDGKDFIIQDFFSGQDGRAINREDAASLPKGTRVLARYKRLTMQVQVN